MNDIAKTDIVCAGDPPNTLRSELLEVVMCRDFTRGLIYFV